jgi:hypothetical protein
MLFGPNMSLVQMWKCCRTMKWAYAFFLNNCFAYYAILQPFSWILICARLWADKSPKWTKAQNKSCNGKKLMQKKCKWSLSTHLSFVLMNLHKFELLFACAFACCAFVRKPWCHVKIWTVKIWTLNIWTIKIWTIKLLTISTKFDACADFFFTFM